MAKSREGSELVTEWGGERARDVKQARKLLDDPAATEEQIRDLAARIFATKDTEETLWWDAYLAPMLAQDRRDRTGPISRRLSVSSVRPETESPGVRARAGGSCTRRRPVDVGRGGALTTVELLRHRELEYMRAMAMTRGKHHFNRRE